MLVRRPSIQTATRCPGLEAFPVAKTVWVRSIRAESVKVTTTARSEQEATIFAEKIVWARIRSRSIYPGYHSKFY